MIEKIKKHLVWQYTCVIFTVSLIIFIGGYGMYNYVITHTLEESLLDYLHEEYREAKEYNSDQQEEIHLAELDSKMVQSFSFWVLDKQIIHADTLAGKIGKDLQTYAQNWQEEDKKIKYITLQDDKGYWTFAAVSQKFEINGKSGDIIVLFNMTPIEKFAAGYRQYGLIILFLMSALSYFIAKNLATRAIGPIINMYNKQKEFVSNASHELKTPLGVLMAYSELIEAKHGKDSNVQVIKEEIKNMSGLIGSLLQLSRLDNENAHLQEYPVMDIIPEIKNIVKKFNQTLTARRAKIGLTLHCKTAKIRTEKENIERILNILLENAVKYTAEDKNITVMVSEEEGKIAIQVKDEGIGIREKEIKHIFERFYRADASHNRNIAGAGLGLSIARAIVTQNGGKISVSSQYGQGSIFKVEFSKA